jgi:phage tail sheath protein FI
MASNYGVNVITSVKASRPIAIESTTPIAIVGYGGALNNGLHYFGNVQAAIEALGEAGESDETLISALTDMEATNVNTPIFLSVVTQGVESGTSGEDDYVSAADATIANITAGVNALKKSAAEFGSKPNLIVAPGYSHNAPVWSALQSVAEALLATGIVDLNAQNETEAITQVANFGTKRLLLCDPYVQTAQGMRPASPLVAAQIAKTDGEREYGFADSFSNRVVNGVFGASRVVEFIAGETCEADRLRTNHITTLIRYNGYRFWGGETTDIDTIWSSLTRVRIFDRIVEAGLEGVFFAIDRRADELIYAKQSIEGMLNNLKGAGVLLGFEVYWDKEQNTKENVTTGKFYLVAELQDTPIVKRLEINFAYSDRWGDVLIDQIS